MTNSLSRAVVFDNGRLAVESFATPAPRAGEVLIAMHGCTFCASDLHTISGRRATQTPLVLGHEAVGEIVDWSGEAPTTWNGERLGRGDRVTWSIAASCGHCFFCDRDLPQKCVTLAKFGHAPASRTVPAALLRGGLADHCLLPVGAALFKPSEKLSLGALCPANCATATVAAAIELAERSLAGQHAWGDRQAIVVGAGMLGLTATAMLVARGASVIAVDRVPHRLDWAKRLGATTFNAHSSDAAADLIAFAKACRSTQAPMGLDCRLGAEADGADCLLEMTGVTDALKLTQPLVRTGGVTVLVGAVYPGEAYPLDMEQLVRREQTVCGVHNYAPRHLQAALDFLEATHAPINELVGAWFDLEQIHDALSEAESGRHVRVGIRFARLGVL